MNGKISTSKNSSVSTLTSNSVNSINYQVYSILNLIHERIKYSYLSKTQTIAVSCGSDLMNKNIKLLSRKI